MELLSVENTKIALRGKVAGPRIAIFASIHGNERVGVIAINQLLTQGLELIRGEVLFVLANPAAYEKGVRQVDLNLNRIFIRNLPYTEPEYVRANELMDILDTVDALLDIHAYNSLADAPFIIGSRNMQSIAQQYPYPIFSHGWDILEPGDTTCYMYNQGKEALCVEAGSVMREEEYVQLAIDSIIAFLAQHGLIDKAMRSYTQKSIHVHTATIKQTEDFLFSKDYKEFEPLIENEVIATDGKITHKAKKGEVIIFPRPNRPIGSGVFILGTYD